MRLLSTTVGRFAFRSAVLMSLLVWSPGDRLQAAATSPDTVDQEFRLAKPGYTYQFPHDHGSHDEFRTEWWYYTGHLKAANGRRFGFQLTFFRRGIDPSAIQTLPSRWTIQQLYLAHFTITDIDAGHFHYGEKISREGLGKAGAKTGDLHVWIDRWSAQALDHQTSRQRLQAAQDHVAIDLTVTPLKPPTLHGHDGVSRKGSENGQASHYYSLTRLATEGRVSINDETFEVSGMSWMDHEFGSADLDHDTVGWDWFSIQLDDGRDIMLYRLRRSDGTAGKASSGTIVEGNGESQLLASSDVSIVPLSYWTSPVSHARYPARWRLMCPSLQLEVDITPLLADQELVTRRSTHVTYWEGAVQIRGTAKGTGVNGQGYVELTGYAERFSQRL